MGSALVHGADSDGASVSTNYAVTIKQNISWSRSDEHYAVTTKEQI